MNKMILGGKFDMKVLKKNQLALLVISLMLITAGYLNYDSMNKEVKETRSRCR